MRPPVSKLNATLKMNTAFAKELDTAKQPENQDDHHDQTEQATGPVTPRARVAPCRQTPDQRKYQDNDQDGHQHVGLLDLKGAMVRRGGMVPANAV